MAFDLATLDAPLAALQAFDWNADGSAFQAVDEAVVAAVGDASLRADLEKKIVTLLGSSTTRAAKEYACRKLAVIGTAAAVPPLAGLLGDKDSSHMARFALERISAPQAADALRQALGRLQGDLRIGMISSLAARGDSSAVPMFAGLLTEDRRTATAAADALGRIASAEAVAVLAKHAATDPTVAAAVVDARLCCAETLLRQGKRAEAAVIYRSIESDSKAARHPAAEDARRAATRGILACLDTSTGS